MRVSSALLFPPTCETCSSLLGFKREIICEACELKIRWIKPPFCKSCGRSLGAPGIQCGHCHKTQFYFDKIFACSYYEGTMRELLHHYKFNEKKYIAAFLANQMMAFMESYTRNLTFNAVVSVPLDRTKQNLRGFNQSGLLAERISRKTLIKNLSRSLHRHKPTAPQFSMDKSDRKKNVLGQFWVLDKSVFKNLHLLLVDDILTTGETLSECARALKDAGAASVTALAVSRGL